MPIYSIQPFPAQSSIENILSGGILWSVFGGALIIFAILSWILVYHWHKFDFSHSVISTQAKIIYFMGSAILIIGMAITLIFYLYGH